MLPVLEGLVVADADEVPVLIAWVRWQVADAPGAVMMAALAHDDGARFARQAGGGQRLVPVLAVSLHTQPMGAVHAVAFLCGQCFGQRAGHAAVVLHDGGALFESFAVGRAGMVSREVGIQARHQLGHRHPVQIQLPAQGVLPCDACGSIPALKLANLGNTSPKVIGQARGCFFLLLINFQG
ncbi:hypothetical protein VI26_04725 [Chromobacterium sp. LK1]|nr:hypothetical protein VI26_04725 [Chromobacterium sp. LK1]